VAGQVLEVEKLERALPIHCTEDVRAAGSGAAMDFGVAGRMSGNEHLGSEAEETPDTFVLKHTA
jgi:hypothetical protein